MPILQFVASPHLLLLLEAEHSVLTLGTSTHSEAPLRFYQLGRSTSVLEFLNIELCFHHPQGSYVDYHRDDHSATSKLAYPRISDLSIVFTLLL